MTLVGSGKKPMTGNEYAERIELLKQQLYRTALLYMGNEADALEAVDECVYKGLCSYRKLRQPEYFATWINRILINVCNDELKRRKRVITMEQLPENAHDYFDALPLKQAISKLPDELRAVISLRFFSGLTQQQTAHALGIPRGTVSTRQARALQLLKLELDDNP